MANTWHPFSGSRCENQQQVLKVVDEESLEIPVNSKINGASTNLDSAEASINELRYLRHGEVESNGDGDGDGDGE